MSRKKKFDVSGKKKWIIGGIIGAAVIGLGGFLWSISQTQTSSVQVPYSTASVTEGSIASSTLLSGTVKALSEQYVYFEAGKGSNATVTVAVGDQVTVGQQLVQYDATTAQAAYDTAIRALNKVGRQINHLQTYGVPMASTAETVDETTGQAVTQTVQPSAETNATYQQQLQDLYDAYADAQAQVNKAQADLNQTIIISDVSGTVVEVNNNVDPSSKESQVLVHVVSEGQLQVHGTLTEYDLPNITAGKAVKIKSKVYPDNEWTGTIASVSNYPNQQAASSNTSGSGSTGATYDYKVDITSDLQNLKQGFTVSVEVVNDKTGLLVPLSAVVNEGDKNYVWVYDDSKSTVSKVEVVLGNADAEKQEVSGLTVGQFVITNPTYDLQEGQKLSDVLSADAAPAESGVTSSD